YRSASAKMSVAFLSHLAALESELQRSAVEERWHIDWAAHESAVRQQQAAFESKDYSAALGALAKGIDVLMAGLMQYRKQMHRQTKWGRAAPPPSEKTEG